ncbi:MAG: hypothetical protein K0S24_4239 [Sphingobacterium sp.]|jgi:hypothetical protein|nr:hypothetical protein [Sphingobacterium sp.]
MKKILVALTLILLSTYLFAQRGDINTDIFGNLQFKSTDGQYKASLEQSIFDKLIFSDSHKNKVEFEKKYLDKIEPGLQGNKESQIRMMKRLIRENRRRSNYKATFKVDIFDKVIVEDNKGYKLEEGKDIFGNMDVKEEFDGSKSQLKKNMRGGLEYTRDNNSASLEKDIFDKWIYKDSFGNEIQFNKVVWNHAVKQYGSEENFFWRLLDQYFY